MSPSQPLSTAGLRAFPPEIRQMIFHLSAALTWTGRTPALIAALRSDPLLYNEALSLFYSQNTFKLHGANQWKTGNMSLSAIQSILALEIDFWSSPDWEEWDTNQIIEPSLHDFHTHPITRASRCETLHLNLSSLGEYNFKACIEPAVICVREMARLRRVTVEVPRVDYRRADDPYDCSGCVGGLVGGLNRALGVGGRLWWVGRCDVKSLKVHWGGVYVWKSQLDC